mmetsp:Transcript_19554/g.57954  ORF Transcript_19554/g.57954 Transcript_19554/m.57954 type:complete len:220 (-) Transcript_19554:138-797(-)
MPLSPLRPQTPGTDSAATAASSATTVGEELGNEAGEALAWRAALRHRDSRHLERAHRQVAHLRVHHPDAHLGLHGEVRERLVVGDLGDDALHNVVDRVLQPRRQLVARRALWHADRHGELLRVKLGRGRGDRLAQVFSRKPGTILLALGHHLVDLGAGHVCAVLHVLHCIVHELARVPRAGVVGLLNHLVEPLPRHIRAILDVGGGLHEQFAPRPAALR